MREKIIAILERYSAGNVVYGYPGDVYLAKEEFDKVADEIVELYKPDNVDWAGLDPVKWEGVDV